MIWKIKDLLILKFGTGSCIGNIHDEAWFQLVRLGCPSCHVKLCEGIRRGAGTHLAHGVQVLLCCVLASKY